MTEPRLIVAAIILLVIVIVIVALAVRGAQRRRSARLRSRFGPEYDRVVREQGNVRRAEATLAERERRASKIVVHPLSADERKRSAEAWRAVQAGFVDEPGRAVAEADRLVEQLMSQRGYPVGNFQTQADDISVDHPMVVQSYRAAHAIAEMQRGGGASTEDLRTAMVHYRKLYDELLSPGSTVSMEVKR